VSKEVDYTEAKGVYYLLNTAAGMTGKKGATIVTFFDRERGAGVSLVCWTSGAESAPVLLIFFQTAENLLDR
jgi:hypothetical protein